MSIAFITVIVSFQFFFSIGYMDGYSMTPNIRNNDILIIDKHASIKRFDLIYFRNPNRPNEYLVRRVIGMPTDKIKYKDDELYVNNVNINEPYLNNKKKMMEPMILTEDFSLQEVVGKDEVPSDYYFVLGDNRNSTVDSRDFGFIPRDSVKGKISSKLSIRN
ncbi:signal peptidase I [Vagococcus martis]|uniref:Signal peptidase I n=2 Tax=Vagococcus martis TaxID=1768210 RepID=A0A1V4DJZ7_9ENTE|nr:signal peptidase I [Vagococcus martis]